MRVMFPTYSLVAEADSISADGLQADRGWAPIVLRLEDV
jgi:hypothetical protein